MTDNFLRRSQVEEIVGLKRSAIYARIPKGEFPEPVRFRDTRRVRWRRSDIDRWMKDQLAG